MVKLVIFDFDDTLFFTTSVHAKSYSQAISELLKIYVSDLMIEKEIKAGAVFPGLLSSFLPEISIDLAKEIHRRKSEIYMKSSSAIRINNRIIDLLPDVSSKYFTAIWSNSSRVNIEMLLIKYHLSVFFDLIYSREDLKYLKPDIRSYIDLCAIFSTSLHESLLVDDSNVNLETIRKSGAVGLLPTNFHLSSF